MWHMVYAATTTNSQAKMLRGGISSASGISHVPAQPFLTTPLPCWQRQEHPFANQDFVKRASAVFSDHNL